MSHFVELFVHQHYFVENVVEVPMQPGFMFTVVC